MTTLTRGRKGCACITTNRMTLWLTINASNEAVREDYDEDKISLEVDEKRFKDCLLRLLI